MTRVLIVDDDPVQLRLTAEVARRAGFAVVTTTGGDEALRMLRDDPGIGVVVLDLVMPDRDGMAVMESMARGGITVPVIVQTGHSELETVVSATRQGAVDFFVKPVPPERLIVSLHNALRLGRLEAVVRSERARASGTLCLADLITSSPAMHRVCDLSRRAARSTLPVLIEGEAGAGKDRLARIIHATSERAAKPFVAFDCDSHPAATIDAALFGPDGALHKANGGTLLLRGLGELSPTGQAHLLRIVEAGEIDTGAARPERINARLVVASPRRLLTLARSGVLREDLYYRLNVLPIYLPPLRDRIDDLEPLTVHFTTRFAAELGRRVHGLSPAALELLSGYDWPGNVRQLENAVFRAVALAMGNTLEPADFPQILAGVRGREQAGQLTAAPTASAPIHVDATIPLARSKPSEAGVPDRFTGTDGVIASLASVERDLIAFALLRCGGHMSRVARALGIGRSTLYRKLREYGLDEPRADRAA